MLARRQQLSVSGGEGGLGGERVESVGAASAGETARQDGTVVQLGAAAAPHRSAPLCRSDTMSRKVCGAVKDTDMLEVLYWCER